MKQMMRRQTIALYIVPIPYAQRHDARATRKPNAKGEMKGDMMKPMVHTFSCVATLRTTVGSDRARVQFTPYELAYGKDTGPSRYKDPTGSGQSLSSRD